MFKYATREDVQAIQQAAANVQMTEKERWLFNRIAEGMDDPGKGWLHELGHAMYTDMNSHQIAGILGSLIQKNLVWSQLHTAQDLCIDEDCYWVGLVGVHG